MVSAQIPEVACKLLWVKELIPPYQLYQMRSTAKLLYFFANPSSGKL